jgi:hypothetical protein
MENEESISALVERTKTRIEMIRKESKILSTKIDRLEEERHELQEQKRLMKSFLADCLQKEALDSLQKEADKYAYTAIST